MHRQRLRPSGECGCGRRLHVTMFRSGHCMRKNDAGRDGLAHSTPTPVVANWCRSTRENELADNTVVHIGENSPERVAFQLLHVVAAVENIVLHSGNLGEDQKRADRAYILRTYKECLSVVRGVKP